MPTPTLQGRALSIQRGKERRAKLKSAKPKPLVAGAMVGAGGSARGDDFAEDFSTAPETEELREEEVDTTPRTRRQLRNAYFGLAGGQGSPTVLTNANKIEKVVPLLNSKMSNLSSLNLSADESSNGGKATGINDTASVGGDDEGSSFDELLGLTGDKKKKKKELGVQYSPLEQQQLSLLEQMSKTQDKRLRKSISDTKRVFNDRQRQQEEATASGLNTIRNVLNLGGSARYAPISSQGLISAAEAAGIKALSDLDSLEQKTIAEIQDARDTLDYQTMEKKFDFLDGIRKDKQVAADELDTAVKEQETQMKNDTAIAGLISQGITDPVQMFQALQAEGNTSISLATITESLKGIGELAKTVGKDARNILDDKSYLKLASVPGMDGVTLQNIVNDLNSGASLDDVLNSIEGTPEEMTAIKNALGITGVASGVTIGKDSKSITEEELVRTRLFPRVSAFLNKGSTSEPDRALIDSKIELFRKAGMGEQEILDAVAGLPPEVATPYNSAFRDLIDSNTDTQEQMMKAMSSLSSQLAHKNYIQAMNNIEGLALKKAKVIGPDSYIDTATAQGVAKKAKELQGLITQYEDKIGPIEGTWERVGGKFKFFRSKEAQELETKIASLVADMRKNFSGSAVTPSEAAFLDPLIPTISDKAENASVKIQGILDRTLGQYNSVRSSVSLPEVTNEQLIDPKKRLGLYSNDIYLPDNGSVDL